MQNISFQGSFIKKVDIKKLGNNGEYRPVRANFVELDHDDINEIKELSQKWENPKSGMRIMVSDDALEPPDVMKNKWKQFLPLAKKMGVKKVLPFLSSKVLGTHVYVVTTQKGNFKKINPDDVLGFVKLTSSQDICELETLHVRPDCISDKYGNQVLFLLKCAFYNMFGMQDKIKKRPFAGVGESIMSTVKSMFSEKKLTLVPLDEAIPFYVKQGFRRFKLEDVEYVYLPEFSK